MGVDRYFESIESITVVFWRKDSWPYSIDERIDGAELDSIEVYKRECFTKHGKLYYKLNVGHGVDVDLLVR